MKKTIVCATMLALGLGIANAAVAADFTTAATTVLGGVSYSPSTGVTVSAAASDVEWAAASKHTAGGTTAYGLHSSDTNIKFLPDQDKADPPPAQGSATALSGF